MSLPATESRPADSVRPRSESATRLRAERAAIAVRSVTAAIARDPSFGERYGEPMRRVFARDGEQHVAEVARALESGNGTSAAVYADSIVPVMRRRGVPMRDVATLLQGLADTLPTALEGDAAADAGRVVQGMIAALDRPGHVAGDRPRGRLAGLLWKAAGFGGW